MPNVRLSLQELRSTKVDDKAVESWEREFALLKEGFHDNIEQFSHKIGVYLVIHNEQVSYIGVGVGKKQGLLARMRQIAFYQSTGANNLGAQCIRKHIDDISLKVIAFERTDDTIKRVRELAKLLKEIHQPSWNRRKKDVDAARLKNILKRRRK